MTVTRRTSEFSKFTRDASNISRLSRAYFVVFAARKLDFLAGNVVAETSHTSKHFNVIIHFLEISRFFFSTILLQIEILSLLYYQFGMTALSFHVTLFLYFILSDIKQ